MVYVDQHNWMSVDRFRVVRFVLGSTMASCNDSCIIDSSGDRLWLLDWDRVVKALPSSREEFQFNWKSTGTRALPICTSRSLTIPPEFFWEQSTKVNNSCEGSTCRPRWSAITLGRMLTDAPVSYKACGNSIPCTVHGIANYPESLFFFNVILLLIISLASQNILLMSSSFSQVSLKNIHNLWLCFATFSSLLLRVLPVETLSSSMGSSPSSEGVLTGSSGCSEGLGFGLSALSRATSIFGICTRHCQGWADVGVLLRTPRELESSRHCKTRLTP
ncbi:hypothetical protein F2Q69_00035775 [Brassica cretica]|uniref:Uncharacterized protein n=1 Tax=Brassica cretica TaxID=69181 RepID=A0A8S9SD84_BRACR|nr:hypothetical protein F2Q69_00035775 [Brassica cretica]